MVKATDRRSVGRLRAFTAEKKIELFAALAMGASRQIACDSICISVDTLVREELRDDDFAVSLKKAEADCQLYHLARVRQGGNSWQSSAWMLERKWWREYSRAAWAEAAGDELRFVIKKLMSSDEEVKDE